MIKAVSVTNSLGETLRMVLMNPWLSGIAIKDIKGLGSPEYDVNTSAHGYGDGSVVGSIRAPTRNILLTLYPLMDKIVEDSRQKLYRFFQVKKPIILTFDLDNRSAMIEGYVESNDPDIFKKRETIQISVICPDPYFRESTITDVRFFGSNPMFEFPFENPVGQKTLHMSELILDSRAYVNYTGEIDTGFNIEIECKEDPGDITITNLHTNGTFHIDAEKVRLITGKKLETNDIIEINTVVGNRYVSLRRGTKTYNILAAVNRNAEWFQLLPGPNTFNYARVNTQISTLYVTFRYRRAYSGL